MSHSLALLAVSRPRLRSSSLLVLHLSGCALSCSCLHRPVCVLSSIPFRCAWFLVSVLRKDSCSRYVRAPIHSIHLVCLHLAVIVHAPLLTVFVILIVYACMELDYYRIKSPFQSSQCVYIYMRGVLSSLLLFDVAC